MWWACEAGRVGPLRLASDNPLHIPGSYTNARWGPGGRRGPELGGAASSQAPAGGKSPLLRRMEPRLPAEDPKQTWVPSLSLGLPASSKAPAAQRRRRALPPVHLSEVSQIGACAASPGAALPSWDACMGFRAGLMGCSVGKLERRAVGQRVSSRACPPLNASALSWRFW